jgi:N-acetylneuraminic acid mutarotase
VLPYSTINVAIKYAFRGSMKIRRVRFAFIFGYILLILILFVLSCSKSKSPTESNGTDSTPDPIAGWTEKSPMPTARFGVAVCKVNNKIFVFGGADGNTALKNVEEYNPGTDSWAVNNPMPTERVAPTTGVVDNKFYVIGGSPTLIIETGLSTVEEYDPTTGSWITKSDMPTARATPVSGVIDRKIYVISGRTGFETDDHQFPMTNVVEMYDPATDTWVEKSPIPTARAHGYGVVLDGIIYVIGGERYEKGEAVEAYDPVSDTWSQKANLPGGGRFAAAAVTLNGKIYVIGGSIIAAETGTSTVFEYDSASDTWKELSNLPIKRLEVSAVELNNKIYIIGGTGGPWPFTPHSTVYEYDPLLYSTD